MTFEPSTSTIEGWMRSQRAGYYFPDAYTRVYTFLTETT